MKDKKLLARLKRDDTAALAEVIRIFSPYVCAIAENVSGGALSREDIEELAADTFTALWYKRMSVEEGNLKAYLAAVVRNKTRSRLRSLHIIVPLEEDVPIAECSLPEEQYIVDEMSRVARQAVDSLPEPEGEIFRRHYFLYQKTQDIANHMGMNAATVRTKLARGRKRLMAYLAERGFDRENLYN